MTTYLQLCKDLRREAGLSGTGPAAVTSQVGMDDKIVNWVKNAWTDIQGFHPNWRFHWKDDGVINCVVNQRDYDPVALGFDFRIIERESVKSYKDTNATERWVDYVEYDDFRRIYMYGANKYGQPIAYTITPDNKIRFYPTPNDTFTVTFEYYRNPQELASNTDVPLMPSQYHIMIVYHALIHYAAHDEAQVVYQDALLHYNRLKTRLEMEQLRTPLLGEALA